MNRKNISEITASACATLALLASLGSGLTIAIATGLAAYLISYAAVRGIGWLLS